MGEKSNLQVTEVKMIIKGEDPRERYKKRDAIGICTEEKGREGETKKGGKFQL